MDQSKRFLLKSTLAWPCMLFWQTDAHSQASEIVVSTQQGKLRGYRERNVCVFKGIPYGNVRASANRLGAPLSPSNWTGIRDAACYGPAAPQIAGGSGQSAELFFPGTDDTTDENCLVLNVWTRNADRACRRPVLVWLHGGNWSRGFGSGSLYDSTDFVDRHDTVNVTLNHRLNALGYLNVSHLGDDRFLDSGCAGMLDIIAALGWVKENIQDFGGDPDNVTIFGQSGGGYKISALLAMEQARGLFHKAIIQSGPQLQLASAENGSLFADRILSKLELRGSSADCLIDVPAEKFVAAYASVYSEIATNGGIEEIVKFRGPILDGRNIHIEPFSDTALEWARDVPLLIGTTACEYPPSRAGFFVPNMGGVGTEWRQKSVELFVSRLLDVDADRAREILNAYCSDLQTKDYAEVFAYLQSDYMMALPSLEIAERRRTAGSAPTFFYQFSFPSPPPNPRSFSKHTAELGFVFNHPGVMYPYVSTQMRLLTDQMSSAWASFAETGDPNHDGMPNWEPYRGFDGPIMSFDSDIEPKSTPLLQGRLELRLEKKLWSK